MIQQNSSDRIHPPGEICLPQLGEIERCGRGYRWLSLR
jgi:hypothetical protein